MSAVKGEPPRGRAPCLGAGARVAVLTAVILSSACPSPGSGHSEDWQRTLAADAAFTVVGSRRQEGLVSGNDVDGDESAIAIVAFELATAGVDIVTQATLAVRQRETRGVPFREGTVVVVDVLDSGLYRDYEWGLSTPDALLSAEALMPRVGVLSRDPLPGERTLDLSQLDFERVMGTLVLRLRMEPADDVDLAEDAVVFDALESSGDPPRLEVVHRIAAH